MEENDREIFSSFSRQLVCEENGNQNKIYRERLWYGVCGIYGVLLTSSGNYINSNYGKNGVTILLESKQILRGKKNLASA